MNPVGRRVAATRQTRGAQRRAAFLKAAMHVFLERGYEGARLEDVIRRAGGSLATLYGQFGDKAGLFAAIIAGICEEIVARLPDLDGPTSASPDKVLLAFGRAYLDLLLTAPSLALYRVAMAESIRSAELGRAVYAAGPAAAASRLAAYLRHQTAAGALRVRDPDLAARHFLEMVKGDLHVRALLRSGAPPSPREVDDCVRAAVRTFLHGVTLQDNRARKGSPRGQGSRPPRANDR